MSTNFSEKSEVAPIMVPRVCGGWLARTPPHHAIRMAVVAASEGEAREKFRTSLGEWDAILVKRQPNRVDALPRN